MTRSLSLVVPTLGRSAELGPLFDSLELQDFADFDVFIVDQNDDDRVAEFVTARPTSLQLTLVRTPGKRGSSRARNSGLALARGEYILFPDDDCWYPSDTLAKFVRLASRTAADIVSGRAVDPAGRSINGRFAAESKRVGRADIWTIQIEWMMLFRRASLEVIGGFAEDIGIGAATPWQSAEGQDITLRALDRGMTCLYDPSIVGFHRELNTETPDAAMIQKGRLYAQGMGYVLGIYRHGLASALYWTGRAVFNAGRALSRGRMDQFRYYSGVAAGRFGGWAAGRAARYCGVLSTRPARSR